MKRSGVVALAALTAAMGTAAAEYWQPVGAKGLAMGGAQVAAPEGSQSVLVNPAALSRKERFDIALPITVTMGAEGGIIETADRLRKNYDTTVKSSVDELKGTTVNNTIAGSMAGVVNFIAGPDAASLNKPGQGILANVNGDLCARWGRLGVAAGTRIMAAGTVRYDNNFTLTSASPTSTWIKNGTVKTTSLAAAASPSATASAIAAEASAGVTSASTVNPNLSAGQIQTVINSITSLPGHGAALTTEEQKLLTSLALETNKSNATTDAAGTKYVNTYTTATKINNQTGIEIRGLFIKEAGVAYGFDFMDKKLSVAPVLKYLQGQTVRTFIGIADETSKSTSISDTLTDDKNSKTSSAVGLDLGLLYQFTPKLSAGLVGKDLTSPKFDLASGGSLKLDPTIRLGGAYEYLQKPGWRGLLTADVDVLESESAVLIGGKSREIACGVSQELMGWLSLRAGVNKNLAGESDSLSYAAGLGVQLWHFYLDVAGSMSSDKVTVDGKDYPTRGGFGATIGWNMNF